MKLTLSEKKFINNCAWRDYFNFAIILAAIVFFRIEDKSNFEEMCKVFIFVWVLLIIPRFFLFKSIEKSIFKHWGKWYCPQCELKHKRNWGNFVSCNRTQNIMENPVNCIISQKNFVMPESWRVFKYAPVLIIPFLKCKFQDEMVDLSKIA